MVHQEVEPYFRAMIKRKNSKSRKEGAADEEISDSRSPSGQPFMPQDSAFLVQFRGSAKRTSKWFVGRVEHVMSGQSADFDTPEGLVEFLGQVIGQLALLGKAKGRK
jgi:hypothetical protein